MPVGTVERLESDFVIVSMKRQDMCGDCHACEMIGEVKKCTLKCVNKCNSQIGDRVEIDVANSSFMKATFIIYGLPLIGLLAGVGIGYKVSEALGIVLGVLFMAGIFGLIKLGEHKNKYQKMLPAVIKVIR